MIKGLVFDTRTWNIDFNSSPYWNPDKYGVSFRLCPDTKSIPNGYDFILATEVWEIPMRKVYSRLNLPVFLAAREPFKTDILKDAMFSYKNFEYNGEFYFTPNLVLSAGYGYSELWKGRAKSVITGYPRFDYYADSSRWPTKESVSRKYGLDANKKWIFFPSYPPYHYKKQGDKDTMIDLFSAREETLVSLENFAEQNDDYHVVVKIHPASMKPFKKGTGKGNEVAGKLLERYRSPSSHMSVIGDVRGSGIESKELLVNSNVVCGFTSTMLLEAAIINKPAVHLLFGNTDSIEGIPEYAKHMPVAKNEKELHSILKRETKYDLSSMVEKYLYKIDGEACKRICEAIKSNL